VRSEKIISNTSTPEDQVFHLVLPPSVQVDAHVVGHTNWEHQHLLSKRTEEKEENE
jgi:hypothetical protein